MNPLERQSVPCPHCEGVGRIPKEQIVYSTDGYRCIRCCGTGKILESAEVWAERAVGIAGELAKLVSVLESQGDISIYTIPDCIQDAHEAWKAREKLCQNG